MPTDKRKVLSIDELALKYLSPKINSNIDDVVLVELNVFDDIEPGVILKADRKDIKIFVSAQIKTKKFLVWLGGLTGSLWVVFQVLNWLIPILEDFYNKSPPFCLQGEIT